MKKLNKKGQILDTMGGIAIGIGTIAIVLVVIFLINDNVTDQAVVQEPSSLLTRVNNETVLVTTVSNTTYLDLTYEGRSKLTCIEVINTSSALGANNAFATQTDFSCVVGNGITVGNASGDVLDQINVSYEYSEGDTAFNSTSTLNNDTYSLVGWIGLVVIILIGILILGLVKQFRQNA